MTKIAHPSGPTARMASAESGNVCAVDDLAEAAVVGMTVPPGDGAADHAGLLGVAGVAGAATVK